MSMVPVSSSRNTPMWWFGRDRMSWYRFLASDMAALNTARFALGETCTDSMPGSRTVSAYESASSATCSPVWASTVTPPHGFRVASKASRLILRPESPESAVGSLDLPTRAAIFALPRLAYFWNSSTDTSGERRASGVERSDA